MTCSGVEMDAKAPVETSSWRHHVVLQWGDGRTERVSGPTAALRALEVKWPPQRGLHFITAKAACLGALNRKCSAELAREAFIAAAIEADLLA